jgi:hypothetical protein
MNIIEELTKLEWYSLEQLRYQKFYKVFYLRRLDELHWKMRSQILTPHI